MRFFESLAFRFHGSNQCKKKGAATPVQGWLAPLPILAVISCCLEVTIAFTMPNPKNPLFQEVTNAHKQHCIQKERYYAFLLGTNILSIANIRGIIPQISSSTLAVECRHAQTATIAKEYISLCRSCTHGTNARHYVTTPSHCMQHGIWFKFDSFANSPKRPIPLGGCKDRGQGRGNDFLRDHQI